MREFLIERRLRARRTHAGRPSLPDRVNQARPGIGLEASESCRVGASRPIANPERSGLVKLEHFSTASTALFLDFDGTLADIVERPQDVRIEPATLAILARLSVLLDGALAIITGRDIATIDQILTPHLLPISGVHGFEIRTQTGTIKRLAAADGALLDVVEKLRAFGNRHEGLLVETKPGSVALHYRGRPDLAEACLAAVAEAVGQAPDLRLMHGKMVVEVKAHGGDKGKAVSAFMQHAPFVSRRPIFIGDDVTDEAAFAEVNKRGGVSIKVGRGQTIANCHLSDTDAVRDWLRRLCDQMENERTGPECAS